MREVTLPILVSLALRLDQRHRAEVLQQYPSLTAWVRSRRALPGLAWAYFVGGEAVFALGVVARGSVGWLWLAGATGWTRYTKQAARLWRAIAVSGAYEGYVCDVFADNAAARRFAERGGFRAIGRRGDLIYYGVKP